MSYIKGQDRSQMYMAPSLEDMVSEDNPVRVIDAFVGSLDLEKMGFSKSKPARTGRPAYDPADLLKLYIYGYCNQIRSSRRLMRECRRNIELFYLLRTLTPDFRTIADFRKDNTEAIRETFRAFSRLCIKLAGPDEFIAIDGSKFRAVNGNKNMFNEKILNSKLERIENKINEYMQKLDKMDEEEADDEEKIPILEKIEERKSRKETYLAYQEELKETGQTQKLTTDPEARMMHSHKDGYHCCYNIQTAVGNDNHFVIDYKVTNHVNDQQILHGFCKQIRETTRQDILSICADKGYDSNDEVLECIMDGTIPYVGFCNDKKDERILVLEHIPQTITEEDRESEKAEDIRRCLHAGVLPKCYEDTNISIQIHGLGQIGAFIREEDKSFVTCPMGHQLKKNKNKRTGHVYVNRLACKQCTNRCTPSKNYKEVYFGPESNCVAALMYGDEPVVNKPPEGFRPANSFFKKNPVETTVILKVKDDIPKQKQRLCISEHPFGTVKWYHGANYVLCKGIRKVTAELGLSFMAYNLKRMVNMFGTKRILEEMAAM